MDFTIFLKHISKALGESLPGESAHLKLEPVSRRKYPPVDDFGAAIPAAVLVLFYHSPDNKIRLIFIQRQQYDGVHSGQISFPGGRFEIGDNNLLITALRETKEEIGIPTELIRPIGQLSQLYIPPSNFLVSPYAAYLEQTPVFEKDDNEVAEVFAIEIAKLIDYRSFQMQRVKGRNYDFDAPCFFVDGRVIWGATAMILNELITIIKPFYEG